MHITRATLVLGLLLLIACGGDDEGPPPWTAGTGGSGGTGGMDASVPLDSGADDASDTDASDEDGGTAPRCAPSDDDRFQSDTVAADPSSFSLYGAPAGFGLAYEVSACGNGIDVTRFPSIGGAFTPQTVINGSGDCSRAYDPALYFSDRMWRLFYWDNRGGQNQLWSLVLDSGDEPVLEVASAASGRAPMLAKIGTDTFLAWIEQSTPASDWTAFYLRKVSATPGAPIAVIAPEVEQHGFSFAFSGIEGVAAVAWVDTVRVDRGAYLQPLNENGEIAGLPVKLAAQVSNKSSVDLADGAMNAAVVYSTVTDNVAFEVRFRQLDESGRPTGTEERIVTRNERGTDASIAPIGNGYVVAYRELPVVADGTALVKLFLIDKNGRRLTTPVDVASTTEGGGRVTVRTSFDGRFTVAWIEADGVSQRVRMVRVPCR